MYFLVVRFKVAELRKQSNCPLSYVTHGVREYDSDLKKEVLSLLTMQTNPEDIVLRDVSQGNRKQAASQYRAWREGVCQGLGRDFEKA